MHLARSTAGRTIVFRGDSRLRERQSGKSEVEGQKTPNTKRRPPGGGLLISLVARTRFELVISALRGRRPEPLDERAIRLLRGI